MDGDLIPSATEVRRIARGRPMMLLLIGPPGAGKSAWRTGYVRACRAPLPHVVSTDDVIEATAAAQGLDYAEAFDLANHAALFADALDRLRRAVAARQDVVVDRTNTTVNVRARWLAEAAPDYLRTALMFDVPLDVLVERLDRRAAETGKFVPLDVVVAMNGWLESPGPGEFDHVWQAVP